VLDEVVLDAETTERVERATGDWTGSIPETAAAQQFADLFCH
jgi:hypothetical protein